MIEEVFQADDGPMFLVRTGTDEQGQPVGYLVNLEAKSAITKLAPLAKFLRFLGDVDFQPLDLKSVPEEVVQLVKQAEQT